MLIRSLASTMTLVVTFLLTSGCSSPSSSTSAGNGDGTSTSDSHAGSEGVGDTGSVQGDSEAPLFLTCAEVCDHLKKAGCKSIAEDTCGGCAAGVFSRFPGCETEKDAALNCLLQVDSTCPKHPCDTVFEKLKTCGKAGEDPCKPACIDIVGGDKPKPCACFATCKGHKWELDCGSSTCQCLKDGSEQSSFEQGTTCDDPGSVFRSKCLPG